MPTLKSNFGMRIIVIVKGQNQEGKVPILPSSHCGWKLLSLVSLNIVKMQKAEGSLKFKALTELLAIFYASD